MNTPPSKGSPDDRQGVLGKHKDRAKKMIRRGKDNQPVGPQQGDPSPQAGYRPGQRPNQRSMQQGQQQQPAQGR